MEVVTLESIATGAALMLGQKVVRNINDTEDDFAVLCKNRMDYVINEVLRKHNWSACKERATLAPLSTAPEFGYNYQFQLPTLCVKILSVKSNQTPVKFSPRKRIIECDYSSIQIEYLGYPTFPSNIDYSLAHAISALLAHDLCYTVTSDNDHQAQLLQKYNSVLSQAKKDDLENSPRGSIRGRLFKNARYTAETELNP